MLHETTLVENHELMELENLDTAVTNLTMIHHHVSKNQKFTQQLDQRTMSLQVQ